MKQDELRHLMDRTRLDTPAHLTSNNELVVPELLGAVCGLLRKIKAEKTSSGFRWPPIWIPVVRELIVELTLEYPDDTVEEIQEHIDITLPHEEMWVNFRYFLDHERFITTLYPYGATWYIDTETSTVYAPDNTWDTEAMQVVMDWAMETTRQELERFLSAPSSYCRHIQEALPLRDRFGRALRREVWETVSGDHYLKDELTESEKQIFEEIVPDLEKGGALPTMTAREYLEYCKICYVGAGMAGDTEENDRLYRRHADGRDDGLLDLPADDPAAFAAWCKQTHIGHPYEIAAGGSITEILLTPVSEEGGYRLLLRGTAVTRATETIRMAIGLHKAGVPVFLVDADIHLRRIRGVDLIGIVPDYYARGYGARGNFPKEDSVYDCYSYDALVAGNPALEHHIKWLPLSLPEVASSEDGQTEK